MAPRISISPAAHVMDLAHASDRPHKILACALMLYPIFSLAPPSRAHAYSGRETRPRYAPSQTGFGLHPLSKPPSTLAMPQGDGHGNGCGLDGFPLCSPSGMAHGGDAFLALERDGPCSPPIRDAAWQCTSLSPVCSASALQYGGATVRIGGGQSGRDPQKVGSQSS